MAFNRPFARNGRFNRGNQGGSFRQNNSRGGNRQNADEQLDYKGIVWGNRFRDQQKPGAPVLQGYATVGGEKLRVVGFLNASPDHRDDAEAQDYKEQIASEINAILVQAQEEFGVAFNLSFQNEEEWRSERDASQRGGRNNFSRGNGDGARQQFRSNRPARQEEQEEDVPFNQQGEDYGEDPEPEPTPAKSRKTTAKAKTASAKRTPRKGGN